MKLEKRKKLIQATIDRVLYCKGYKLKLQELNDQFVVKKEINYLKLEKDK